MLAEMKCVFNSQVLWTEDHKSSATVQSSSSKGAEGGEVWGGAMPPPQKFFSIFSLKITIFGAFWAAIFTVQRTVLY